jgi:uncharacterized protein YqhQ
MCFNYVSLQIEAFVVQKNYISLFVVFGLFCFKLVPKFLGEKFSSINAEQKVGRWNDLCAWVCVC